MMIISMGDIDRIIVDVIATIIIGQAATTMTITTVMITHIGTILATTIIIANKQEASIARFPQKRILSWTAWKEN
jgi:hypothetical protein